MPNRFYKNKKTDKELWVDDPDTIGMHEFSFDGKKIFNMFRDYPYKLTKEEKTIFDKENLFGQTFSKIECNPNGYFAETVK